MRSASVSANAGATRAQNPQTRTMVFISAQQTSMPAGDNPTPIQRLYSEQAASPHFQQAPAADPRASRLLDEPKLTFAGFRQFRRTIARQGQGAQRKINQNPFARA